MSLNSAIERSTSVPLPQSRKQSSTSLPLVQSEAEDVTVELASVPSGAVSVKTESNELKSDSYINSPKYKYNIRNEMKCYVPESIQQTQKQIDAGTLRMKVVHELIELFQSEKTESNELKSDEHIFTNEYTNINKISQNQYNTSIINKNSNKPSNKRISISDEIALSVPKPIQQAGALRMKVVNELLQTEKTYVECLNNLIRHFMIPLSSKINGKLLLSLKKHQTIFPSNIRTIYIFHSKLLVEFAKVHSNWDNDTSKIGNIFVKYGQLFKMYQNYMNNYEKAVSCLSTLKNKNKNKFSEWCEKTRDKCNNYGLDSLLILPIQRIPRYQLLLKELIKRTEQYDINHIDLYDLRNAFNAITKVTTLINYRMKQNDSRQKVTLIESKFDWSLMDKLGEHLVTPSRYFIAESAYNLHDENYIIKHNKNGTESLIVLFVFNDCLIYGHYENLVKDFLKFDHLISFDEIFKLEDISKKEYNNLHCLKIYGRQNSLWISFKNKQYKFQWMRLLIQTNEKANKKSIKYKYSMNINIPCPLFVPNDYSNNCLICKHKFSLMNRRHHCYFCGILACSKCTDYRLKSLWKENEIIRVCNGCHARYKNESHGYNYYQCTNSKMCYAFLTNEMKYKT